VVAVVLSMVVLFGLTATDTNVVDAGTRIVRVPQDVATLQEAVDASSPGDLILLDRGTYPGAIAVPENKPGLTIRGVDRNAVVFDGEDVRENAIDVEADGVTLENMSAHNFRGNGFYWDGVVGFQGRYLTVWNVNLYGIYAIESRDGLFEQSYVSGAADAAFYIGECNPCNTVLTDLVARYSAIGYSGTNAGGNLEIRDSLWELNGTAILPNSFNGQPAPPPQRDSLIAGNLIRDSGRLPVPANSPLAGFIGIGIGIAGGQDNVIEDNEITGSDRYGIALFPTLQEDGSRWQANGNEARRNRVSGSGVADLGVAEGSQVPNCFAGNTFSSSLPAAIETVMPCDGQPSSDGDARVSADLAIPVPVALDQQGERPRYQDMPVPEPQPTMPDPATAPSPGVPSPGGSSAASATPGVPGASPSGAQPSASGPGTGATPSTSPAAPSGAGSSVEPAILAVAVAVLAGAALVGWLGWRRRRDGVVK